MKFPERILNGLANYVVQTKGSFKIKFSSSRFVLDTLPPY
jgi:flagellar biosynthesis component FlhA